MDRRQNIEVLVETVAPAGKRVIDVGCGDGHLVRLLTGHGAHVLGVECSPRQLAKAWALPPVGDERIVEGVGEALPAPDGDADLVVFFKSLHHVPRPAIPQALAEAARVLRRGGQVYICEPLPEGRFFEAVRPVDDETEVRAAALAAIADCSRWGLAPQREFRYLHAVVMESYEAFRDRIISANSEREARFAELDAEMRTLFDAKAEPCAEGGYRFDQPMRVNLLRKP